MPPLTRSGGREGGNAEEIMSKDWEIYPGGS